MQREGPGWVGDSSDFFCQQRGKGWSLLLNSVVIPDSLCLVSCKGLRVGEGVGGGSWGVEYCKNCCGNATVPAGAGRDGSGVAAPAIHCENRCTYVSARPHRCSFLSSSECVDLLLQLPAPASCGRHAEWGAGGEGMHAPGGDSSPQPGTGAGFGLVLCCFPETSAKLVAIHCQPRWEDIGRRCFRSSCHTVFLCKKNVKLLYNLFLI